MPSEIAMKTIVRELSMCMPLRLHTGFRFFGEIFLCEGSRKSPENLFVSESGNLDVTSLVHF